MKIYIVFGTNGTLTQMVISVHSTELGAHKSCESMAKFMPNWDFSYEPMLVEE